MFPASVLLIWGLTTFAKLFATAVVYKGRRQYPLFFVYLCWSSAVALFLWYPALTRNYFLYFYGNYYGLIISDALLMCVLFDFGRLLFWPLWIVPKDVRLFTTFGLLVVAAGVAIHSITDASHYPNALVAFARTAGRASNVVLLAALSTLVLLSRFLRIPWRKRAAGIAIGLAAHFVVSTITAMITISAMPALLNAVQWAHLSAYIVAAIIWAISFSRPDTELHTLGEHDLDKLSHITGVLNNWREYSAESPIS